MMLKTEFGRVMAKAAVISQSQFMAGTLDVYFSEFESWPIDVFTQSIISAARQSNRFPTVNQIRMAKPVRSNNRVLQMIKFDKERAAKEDKEAVMADIQEMRKRIRGRK